MIIGSPLRWFGFVPNVTGSFIEKFKGELFMATLGRDIINGKWGVKVQVKESTFNGESQLKVSMCPIAMTPSGPKIQMHKVTESQFNRRDDRYAPWGRYSPQVYIATEDIEAVTSALLEAKAAIIEGGPKLDEWLDRGRRNHDGPNQQTAPQWNMPEF